MDTKVQHGYLVLADIQQYRERVRLIANETQHEAALQPALATA